MSDNAQADGSDRSGTPKADAGAEGKTPSSESKSWLDGLDTGTRELTKARGWESADAAEVAPKILSSFKELEGKLGKSITVPGDDAKPEEVAKFHERLGRPKEATGKEGYEFSMPKEYPEGLPYNQEFAESIKPIFHKAGLSKKAADEIHGGFTMLMADLTKQQVAETVKKVESTADALVKDWGPQDSEAFKTNSSTVTKTLEKLGLTESLKEVGLILEDGSLTNPAIARAALSIGKSMFTEDDLEGESGSDSGGGKNPWKADTLNTGEQNRIIRAAQNGGKTEKEKARRLLREAGKIPERFGL